MFCFQQRRNQRPRSVTNLIQGLPIAQLPMVGSLFTTVSSTAMPLVSQLFASVSPTSLPMVGSLLNVLPLNSLLPVGNLPIMEHMVRLLKRHGFTDLSVLLYFLPDSITSTVFERMKKERETLVATYQSAGDREVKNIKAKADAAAHAIVAGANAEREKIIGKAEQEAAKYYAVFEQKPELAKFLFDLKAVEQSLKERSSLILGPQTPPFNLLNGATNNNSSPSTR